MPTCIRINPQKQIILIISNLDNTIQIPTLKSRLETHMISIIGIHPMKRIFILGLELTIEFFEKWF
jgi:hypothetical protein